MSDEKTVKVQGSASEVVKAIPQPDSAIEADEISDIELEQVAGGGGPLNTLNCTC